MLEFSGLGSFNVIEFSIKQLLKSTIEMLYSLALRLEITSVFSPVFHVKLYGGTLPKILTEIAPS